MGPWQTHLSLSRCLVEEASEVLEAIDCDDSELMEEELGDLLLQVVMHACLAEEVGRFDLEGVARGINEKLIRRHPHVFGDDAGQINSSAEVLDRWSKSKSEEKKNRSSGDRPIKLFKDLPPRLPALLFAHGVYKRALKAELESEGEWNDPKAKDFSDGLDENSAGRLCLSWWAHAEGLALTRRRPCVGSHPVKCHCWSLRLRKKVIMPEKIERVLLDGEQGARSIECVLRKSNRARRMNLRVASRETAILTLPRRSSWSEGLGFLESHREWLRKKTLGFPSVTRLEEYFRKGGKVWLDENPRTFRMDPSGSLSGRFAFNR